jgi:beta-fructofuranosidase
MDIWLACAALILATCLGTQAWAAGQQGPSGAAPGEGSTADEAAIAKAMAAVQAAAARVADDPTRPVYHFRPPAQWMNDPTGTIFHKGWFHLFYQFNPYGDAWGATGTCWGHSRSRDLVHWEHLPIALHPRVDRGEKRCNSGSMALDGDSRPIIFYTSVPVDEKKNPREQWAAAAQDDDLIRWTRVAGNPIIAPSADGGAHGSWGDPFVFRAGGRTFLTGKAKTSGIPLYEAQDATLTRWKYLGPLTEFNGECPNFFALGGKWVLLTSPGSQTRWYVGSLDLASLKFKPQEDGILDHSYGPKWPDNWSRGFYATTVTFDPQGRCLLWGWVSGFRKGLGWSGCLALPRVFTLGPDGRPRQIPAPEIETLRGEHVRLDALELGGDPRVLEAIRGDTLEVRVAFVPGNARTFGLKVRRSADGTRAVVIRCDGEALDVAGTIVPLASGEVRKPLTPHVFLDKTVMEVFVNDGREVVTRVIDADPRDMGVEVFAEGGKARVTSLDAWQMKPVWGQVAPGK